MGIPWEEGFNTILTLEAPKPRRNIPREAAILIGSGTENSINAAMRKTGKMLLTCKTAEILSFVVCSILDPHVVIEGTTNNG